MWLLYRYTVNEFHKNISEYERISHRKREGTHWRQIFLYWPSVRARHASQDASRFAIIDTTQFSPKHRHTYTRISHIQSNSTVGVRNACETNVVLLYIAHHIHISSSSSFFHLPKLVHHRLNKLCPAGLKCDNFSNYCIFSEVLYIAHRFMWSIFYIKCYAKFRKAGERWKIYRYAEKAFFNLQISIIF